ncbi:copper amine oxidase N-terminal domain-containing protein [Paenibacillus mucilaginosus]|uniref:Copper amine oxidase-like N-terminal domain-containing protein n=2 Tax=Paenibacillus mucilaginosus TaxID=61624 RepID=H6NBT4_9BACL|nr:copper amine oxidase N-terminal domain-containing protein [Paenibacillus mucilaginosus]AEI42073.1 hypothetical protein KNP414_03529 [Paenibacillus mucilaginosus KNP414]AFC27885.1 hypothetical protein PM3016_944 [Paenibacillus mucilaginosus 3016]MCG7214060.1 copper amine oxidase N-terminal domain-containing protein [Paenibacillus mucilaginosus]WDM28584.1 copper amine oxidase N-terminal domain-containing protein [Paenibacillus mucilaginosus]WFA16749.1 copper amine oxidase N-terminal domain-co
MKTLSAKVLPLALSLALTLPVAAASLPYITNVASAHTLSVNSPASDLRATVDRLLGEHALLAILAMQKGIDGAADFNDAAAALDKNSDELSDAIGSVYGKEAGDQFRVLWKKHIPFFVDYVKATAANDEAGRKTAVDELVEYAGEFGAFLESANPNFKQADIVASLKGHVSTLITAFDKYNAKDYTAAYASVREAYGHMFMTGDYLASGIAKQYPDQFNWSGTSQKASDLRIAVDRLLAEHGFLAALTMQKGLDGAPDFAAAAAALDQNSDELSDAIGSVYGKEAGDQFRVLWKKHIGFFVDYVTAAAKMDEAGRKEAIDELTEYAGEFAAFLAGANPNLSKDSLAKELDNHVGHLQKAFDSYAAKDYASAYSSLRTAYSHMYMTGDSLSGAIVTQFNEKFHDAGMAASPKVWMKIGGSELMIDDKTVVMDTAPYMSGTHTYIPLRYLAEAIGAEVKWEEAARTIRVMTGGNTATFWIDKDYMELNGEPQAIGSPVMMKDGRTQVPLRFITELLGWDVKWNESDWSITLTKAMSMTSSPAHSH